MNGAGKPAVHFSSDTLDAEPSEPEEKTGSVPRFGRSTSIYKKGSKHIVYYAVRVHSLSNISNIEQSFDCSFDIIMQWMASRDEMLKYVEDNEGENPTEIAELKAKLEAMNISTSKLPMADEEEKKQATGSGRDEMFKKGLFMLKQLADKQIGTKPTKSTVIWKPPEIRFPALMEHTQDPEDHGLEHIIVGDADPSSKLTEFQFKEKRSYNCRFRERMELESFPFDVQSFSIKLVFPVSTDEAHFVPLPGTFIEVEKMHNLSEFEMKQPLFIQDIETVRDFEFDQLLGNPNVNTFTTIDIKLKGVRNWRSYFFRIFVLSFLIALTLLLVFVTPAEDVADRLAHGVTILLTMVAFQFVVQTLLPQLGYLTFMDSYLLGADVYISIVIIAACVPQLFVEWEFLDDPVTLDSIFFALSFAVLMVMSIVQCCYVKWSLIPKEQEKLSRWRDDVKSTDFTIEYRERPKVDGDGNAIEPRIAEGVDPKLMAQIKDKFRENELFFENHDDKFPDIFPAIPVTEPKGTSEEKPWDPPRFAIIKQLVDKTRKQMERGQENVEVERYEKDHPPYKRIIGETEARKMKARKSKSGKGDDAPVKPALPSSVTVRNIL